MALRAVIKADLAASSAAGPIKPAKLRAILKSAVNTTAIGFVSSSVKTIAGRINLTAADIRKNFVQVRRASAKDPTATVKATRKGSPLVKFLTNAAVIKGFKRPPNGLRVKVRPGVGIEPHPHSFLAVMKSGHIGIFHRGERQNYVPGSPRLPIYEEFGPTALGVFVNAPGPSGSGTVLQEQVAASAEQLQQLADAAMNQMLHEWDKAH